MWKMYKSMGENIRDIRCYWGNKSDWVYLSS